MFLANIAVLNTVHYKTLHTRVSSVSMSTLERSILNSIFHFNHTHNLHYVEGCLNSMERFLDLIQLFFWVVCSALFFPNVFVTMRTFFRWETIQTVSHKAPDTPVRFPSIVVCSKEPFKDPDRPMLTLQEFEENTYNDQEFVITLNSTFHNGTTTWTNSTWNSVMKGRCMVLDMDQSVSLSPFLLNSI